MISTSIVSHWGICFEGFSVMVLRLLARSASWTGAAQIEVRQVTEHEGVTAICALVASAAYRVPFITIGHSMTGKTPAVREAPAPA